MENVSVQGAPRLRSLDALRGFDMFWIAGGDALFGALADLTGWPALVWWKGQLEHVEWNGFRFEDMIFPLFLFIAGIAFPYSMAKRLGGAEGRRSLYRHVVLRGLILVLLGIVYNNGVSFHFGEMRYGSVLGRIGLAWMGGALIFMNCRVRATLLWIVGLLVGYWLLLRFTHAPDMGSSDPYSMRGCIVGYVDRLLLPGRLYKEIHDPEGILSTLPAVATALLGMLTGHVVMHRSLEQAKPWATVFGLTAAGLGLATIGWLWDFVFPINKNLWTSSFVCWVGGLSLLLFALFYGVIDVCKAEKWSRFFAVIGVNSIAVYLAPRIVDFEKAAQFFFGGLVALAPEAWRGVLGAVAYLAVVWAFLYVLYRKKIFIKV